MAPDWVAPVSTVYEDRPVGSVLTGTSRRSTRRVRSRWLVHLCLMVAFAGSVVELVLTTGLTVLILLGLAFVGLVAVHVGQRRQTSARLLATLVRVRSWFRPRGRMAWSDLILALLTLNVLASGLVDGSPVPTPRSRSARSGSTALHQLARRVGDRPPGVPRGPRVPPRTASPRLGDPLVRHLFRQDSTVTPKRSV